jgi:hypothetical protein
MKTLNHLRDRANKYAPRYDYARRAVRTEKAALADARTEYKNVATAQGIVQATAQQIQQAAHDRIAAVVSECLRSVFETPYAFKILFERKRGRTEAVLQFVRGELEIDPLGAAGGGVIDVAAFALRVACLVLARPPLRRLLVLDEPFSHCKPPEVLAPRICKMLEMLAEQFGIQFVLIPSIENHYRIGKVIEIA